jgi:ClpP class serine protease
MILCAGDRVYADRSSVVGSIGVVMQRVDLRGISEWCQLGGKIHTTDKYKTF